MLCCNIKPNKWKQGLYHPLTISARSWESISMDFLGGLSTIGKVIWLFIYGSWGLEKCESWCLVKRPLEENKKITCSLNRSWWTLGHQWGSSQTRILDLLVNFGLHLGGIWTLDSYWNTLRENMDTRLKWCTTFHP